MFKYTAIVLTLITLIIVPVNAQQEVESAGQLSTEAVIEVVVEEEVQEVVGEAAEGVVGEEVAEQEVEEAEATLALNDGMVTIDFRDADIKDVLRILSFKSGVNIVAGPEVTGIVTIQLENVPWQRALDVVLQTYGYAYDRRDSIITVTTIENLKKRREDAMLLSEQEPLVNRAIVLNYAKASKIIESVLKMRTERGTINYDERTNSIIVRDTATNVEMIEEIIKQLDATTPQVLIEAKIIETQLGKNDALGIDWTVQSSVNAASWPTSWPFNRRGTDYIPDVSAIAPSATNFTYGTLDFTAFEAILQMLETRTDTNIVSNPRIVTLDNQAARIVVGDQYPFPDYTYNEEQGKMQVSGWTYKDIGVIFEVTPHVNNAGMVTLDLEPKITAIAGQVEVEGGTSVPQLTTREAKTRVMIKDGETLVIGGLISDEEIDIESKVPFLGDIPLLGRLFRHQSKEKTKIDLMIFLTPHIITPDGYSKE